MTQLKRTGSCWWGARSCRTTTPYSPPRTMPISCPFVPFKHRREYVDIASRDYSNTARREGKLVVVVFSLKTSRTKQRLRPNAQQYELKDDGSQCIACFSAGMLIIDLVGFPLINTEDDGYSPERGERWNGPELPYHVLIILVVDFCPIKKSTRDFFSGAAHTLPHTLQEVSISQRFNSFNRRCYVLGNIYYLCSFRYGIFGVYVIDHVF